MATSQGLYSTALDGEIPDEADSGPSGQRDQRRRSEGAGREPGHACERHALRSVPGFGVYASTNRGISWTLSKSLPLSQRIKLAVGSDGTFYVAELGSIRPPRQAPRQARRPWNSTTPDLTNSAGVQILSVSTVAGAVAAGATSVTVADGTRFVVNGTVVVGKDAGRIAAVNGNVLTLTSTTLAAAVVLPPQPAAGPRTVTVASATGFAAGRTITIDTGAGAETVVIESVAGTVLTLKTNLAKAHAANASVTLVFANAHVVNEAVTMLWQTTGFGYASKVAVAIAAGSNTLTVTVTDASGFVPGTITIGQGANAETAVIASISGNVLTLRAGLTKAHPATTPAPGPPADDVVMSWDDMSTLAASIKTNYEAKRVTLTKAVTLPAPILAHPVGRAVTFGKIRLVAVYKVSASVVSPTSGDFAAVALPTTTESNGKVNGLQQYQGDKHFSMAVDPVNPAVIYLGGAIQPTSNNRDFTLAAAVAAGQLEMKVNTVLGIAAGQTLVVGAGAASQESVQVKVGGVTAGTRLRIEVDVFAGQSLVYVSSTDAFTTGTQVVVEGSGKLSLATVQSVKDNRATELPLKVAVAVGGTTLRLDPSTSFKSGDRIRIVEGAKSETATVREVLVGSTGITLFITVGLKNAHTTNAKVVVLSTVTLTTELNESFVAGATIGTFGTVGLTAALTKAHTRGETIRLTQTAAGNTDWTGRLFRVDTTPPMFPTLISASGASGGGWNGMTPSAPHGDSRSMTVVTDPATNSRYLIETDDGGIYQARAVDRRTSRRQRRTASGSRSTAPSRAKVNGPNALAVAEVGSVAYDPRATTSTSSARRMPGHRGRQAPGNSVDRR